jgi:hypothetical protein
MVAWMFGESAEVQMGFATSFEIGLILSANGFKDGISLPELTM